MLNSFAKRIVLGDTTTHGGRVTNASSPDSYGPYRYARSGDSVYCPKCGGYYSIEQNPLDQYGLELPYSVEGQRTSCGATLVSRDSLGLIMQEDGTIRSVFSDFRAIEICEYINKYKSGVKPYDHGDVFSYSGGTSSPVLRNRSENQEPEEPKKQKRTENAWIQYKKNL
ncbi:MAG: PAAR domain-containing protein [Desulfovibrio sp.]|jgi:uncharacterized Zn-binding protein involved in type VI secretion|nr:PAAR domain-containing protein [Desulfovibrio sp.]